MKKKNKVLVCTANRLVRQEMSRTPSYTMQYCYLAGQLARTLIVLAKPAQFIGKPLLAGSGVCGNNLYE